SSPTDIRLVPALATSTAVCTKWLRRHPGCSTISALVTILSRWLSAADSCAARRARSPSATARALDTTLSPDWDRWTFQHSLQPGTISKSTQRKLQYETHQSDSTSVSGGNRLRARRAIRLQPFN